MRPVLRRKPVTQRAEPVVFVGRVPAQLRRWVAKHAAQRVRMVTHSTEGGLRYEAECRVGWSCAGRHGAVVHTVVEMIEALAACAPCKCAQCRGN